MSTSLAVLRFYCVYIFWGQGEVTVDRKHSFRRVMLFSRVCLRCGHFSLTIFFKNPSGLVLICLGETTVCTKIVSMGKSTKMRTFSWTLWYIPCFWHLLLKNKKIICPYPYLTSFATFLSLIYCTRLGFLTMPLYTLYCTLLRSIIS